MGVSLLGRAARAVRAACAMWGCMVGLGGGGREAWAGRYVRVVVCGCNVCGVCGMFVVGWTQVGAAEARPRACGVACCCVDQI